MHKAPIPQGGSTSEGQSCLSDAGLPRTGTFEAAGLTKGLQQEKQMSTVAAVETVSKSKTEYTEVTMSDGRKVSFAGKRKVSKETVIDESKIAVDGNVIQLDLGAVSIRMDFRNGETRLIALPPALLAQFAGHGAEQKFGDELASPADKPLSEEDMVLAIDDLNAQIQAGNWGKGRASGGGGVSGASVVVQAIMEATGKDFATVKAYLQKKLDGDKDLSRRALYDSFRVAGTKTGIIIKRLEEAKLAKTAKVDADAELAGI